MQFSTFSKANRIRCEHPQGFNHKINFWSLSDWMTATMGELGEAANLAKKLNRVRDGIPGNDKTKEELQIALRKEIADVLVYLDLMSQHLGFSLEDAVRDKWNETSTKIGYPLRLRQED